MATELEKLRKQAEKLLEQEKFKEIIELLPDNILEKHKDAELYAWRARAHYRLDENDKAFNYAQKAIDANDNYWMGYLARGATWHNKSEYDKAITDYTKAIELNPDNAIAYNNRGNPWVSKGDNDKAIADYTKAIELNPNYALAYNNRGHVWSDKREYDKAIADYSKVIELKPEDADAYNIRGRAWDNNGEYNKAIDDYNKSIELNPNNAIVYYNRGIAWKKKGENDKAIDDYTRSIELKPDHASAYNNRGTIWDTIGELNKAIDDFTKSIEFENNLLWRPLWNRSLTNLKIAEKKREENNFFDAAECLKKAKEDIENAIKNKPTDNEFLKTHESNILSFNKLLNESINSQQTLKEVAAMKAEVKEARDNIDKQSKEVGDIIKREVDDLRRSIKEQAASVTNISENYSKLLKDVDVSELKLKSLEKFYEPILNDFEVKRKRAEKTVFYRGILLAIASVACVTLITCYFLHQDTIQKQELFLLYLITLTAISLAPLIWMLRLAIKRRDELLILETEYRHKSTMAGSLWAFKNVLAETYTKELSKLAFETLYGQNPVNLLIEDTKQNKKPKKEHDYPVMAYELFKETIPRIVEKAMEAALNKKKDTDGK